MLIQNVEEKFSTASLDRYHKFASPGTNNKGHMVYHTPMPEAAMSPMHQKASMATIGQSGKENLVDLNVKELRENFDRIPHHVKY